MGSITNPNSERLDDIRIMYFNIPSNDCVINEKYISDLFYYDDMIELLKDIKGVKHNIKEFLKQNKYVKYADNGEDHIYLYPNNKFFKKYKTEETQIEFIKMVIIDFMKELEYEGSEDVIEYADIYIIQETEKPIIKIIFI